MLMELQGIFVSVGSEIIIELTKKIICAICNGDFQETMLKKAELEKQANYYFLEEKEMIFRLIQLLNNYENMVNRKSRYTPYILTEIEEIVRKIEEVRRTRHIDVLC